MSDSGRWVARQALLAVVSRGAGVALLVVLTPYLASRLGADGYGIWVLVTASTGLMGASTLASHPVWRGGSRTPRRVRTGRRSRAP